MPRIRSIKPELWLSPQVMNLSHSSRLMFLGLITQADDDGRGLADTRRLKAAIFPGDECSLEDVAGWLAEVGAEKLALLYSDSHGTPLYQLTGWHSHQRVPKPSPSNYEPPTGTLPERSGNAIVGSEGKERKGKEGNGTDGTECSVPGLDAKAWQTWTAYRREIRKPLKPVSIPAAQRELAAFGCNQAAVVEQSIAHGWQGLFALKPRLNGSTGNIPPKREREPTAAEIEAAREKAAAENRRALQRLGLGDFGKVP